MAQAPSLFPVPLIRPAIVRLHLQAAPDLRQAARRIVLQAFRKA
jgi:hypothetical protein